MTITGLGQRFRLVERSLDEGGGVVFQERIENFAHESVWIDLNEKRIPFALAYELARELKSEANNCAEICLRRGCKHCAGVILDNIVPADAP